MSDEVNNDTNEAVTNSDVDEAGEDAVAVALAEIEAARVEMPEDVDGAVARVLAQVDVLIDEGELGEAFDALIEAGEWQGGSGNPTAALETFARARDLAIDGGAPQPVAHALDRMAACHWELGQLARTEHLLREALAIREAGSDGPALARARYRLGWRIAVDCSSTSRFDEALNLLGRARDGAEEHGLTLMVAECDEKASWVLGARGDVADAVTLLRKSIAVMKACGETGRVETVRTNLANQLMTLGEHEEAEFQFRTAWESSRDRGIPNASIAARLAGVLTGSGREVDAHRLLDEVEPHLSHGDRGERAHFDLVRARTYRALGMRVSARESAERALRHLRGALLPTSHAEALEVLAGCLADDADQGGPEAAELRQRSGVILGEALALYVFADEMASASRLAGAMIPSPPSDADDIDPDPTPVSTGVYL